MNRESPTVIASGPKDGPRSVVPASESDIRIYGNSENYFWWWKMAAFYYDLNKIWIWNKVIAIQNSYSNLKSKNS